jgi:hypothetical protein
MNRTEFSPRYWLVFAAAAWTAAGCATTPYVPGSNTWQGPADSGAFITTLGNDTIAIERFVIRGNTLDTKAVTRSPRTTLYDLHMEWTDDGRLSAYELRERAPGMPQDSVRGSVSLVSRGDSVVWTRQRQGQTRSMTQAAANVRAVFVPPLYSPYAVLSRIVLARGDTAAFVVMQGGGFTMNVSRPDPAWIALHEPQLRTIRLRLDPTLRVHEVDATGSTLGSRAHRVTDADIEAWARTFAARDAAGQSIGMLSLPDSVHATVGGANVAIVYHRPARRGRVIFGGVVPYARVWRTGANQATAFTTDRDLMIGGVRVPAGSYTIWTIPGEQRWQLILNKQTGQWGTMYNATQDLVHIPMTVETLPEPVDRFTIALTPMADASRLTLEWDRTRAAVDVRSAN